MSDDDEGDDIATLLEDAQSHREKFEELVETAKEEFAKDVANEFAEVANVEVSHDSDAEELVAEVDLPSVADDLGDGVEQTEPAVFTRTTGWSGPEGEPYEYDADIIKTGVSSSQRSRTKELKDVIEEIKEEREEIGAPEADVIAEMVDRGFEREKVEHDIEKLKRKGEVYMPMADVLMPA